jgi:hypothetical protein
MFEATDLMKYSFGYLFAGLSICFLAIVVLFARVWILSSAVQSMQSELTSVKQSTAGLGEFMTAIQLHMGKLWFAAKAGNWELANYEVNELRETMEGAKSLHAVKNGVDVSKVLDAVLQTQMAQLSQSITSKKASDFEKAYDDARSACNGCHEETGQKFIHIIRPTAPPVTNQRWDLSATR